MLEILTKSKSETQKVAALLARSVKPPVVVALVGELGAGKTTFAQGFAHALGVKEKIQSPTFVLLKIYKIKKGTVRHLVHIDCYRINSPKDMLHLGFKNLLRDKDAIIVIEWAERVRRLLPKHTRWIKFQHGRYPRERLISIRP